MQKSETIDDEGDDAVATQHGLRWGPAEVKLITSVVRSNGCYRVLSVSSDCDKITVYISPKGKFRVFRRNKELKKESDDTAQK